MRTDLPIEVGRPTRQARFDIGLHQSRVNADEFGGKFTHNDGELQGGSRGRRSSGVDGFDHDAVASGFLWDTFDAWCRCHRINNHPKALREIGSRVAWVPEAQGCSC